MIIKKSRIFMSLVLAGVIISTPIPRTITANAKEKNTIPEYTYKVDVDALDIKVENNKLLIKENSKAIYKGSDIKSKRVIGPNESLNQKNILENKIITNEGLYDSIKNLATNTSESNKIITVSVTDTYYKVDEETTEMAKVTKEEYEENVLGKSKKEENNNDSLISKITDKFLPTTAYAATIGNSPSSNGLYGKLTLTTSVSVNLSSGSSRVFWAQSNAYWSGSHTYSSSKDFISIGIDTSSWKPTNNQITTISSYGTTNPSWANRTLSSANGSGLAWGFNFHQTGYQAYDYLTGIYAGANYAYGPDSWVTFYSNYTHTYAAINPGVSVSSAGTISVSGISLYDTTANYATCYLTTYYSA